MSSVLRRYGLLVFLLVLGVLSACGKEDSPREPTAEDIARAEEYSRQREADEKQIQKDLRGASKDQLIALFDECENIASLKATESYRQFQPFLIDERSADIYQIAAAANGISIVSNEDRARNLMKNRKDQGIELYFDRGYPFVVTEDSFDGLKRRVETVFCTLQPGLKVTR